MPLEIGEEEEFGVWSWELGGERLRRWSLEFGVWSWGGSGCAAGVWRLELGGAAAPLELGEEEELGDGRARLRRWSWEMGVRMGIG